MTIEEIKAECASVTEWAGGLRDHDMVLRFASRAAKALPIALDAWMEAVASTDCDIERTIKAITAAFAK